MIVLVSVGYNVITHQRKKSNPLCLSEIVFLEPVFVRLRSVVMTSLLILRVIMLNSLQVLCLSSQDYVSSLNAQKTKDCLTCSKLHAENLTQMGKSLHLMHGGKKFSQTSHHQSTS